LWGFRNVSSWMASFLLVKRMGTVFLRRLQFCSAVILSTNIALIGYTLFNLMSPRGNEIAYLRFGGVLLYCCTVFFVLVLFMIWYGAKANGCSQAAQLHIRNHEIFLFEHPTKVLDNKETVSALLSTGDRSKLLNSCTEALRLDDSVNPLRLFGLRADTTMFVTLFSVFVSVGSSIISLHLY